MSEMQRYWDDVVEGEVLDDLPFPLTVYRLVMTAGASRDFNAIHHNAEVARAAGASDMYANTLFLQGMWERFEFEVCSTNSRGVSVGPGRILAEMPRVGP